MTVSRETWELLLKGIGAFATIMTVVVSAAVFFHQRSQSIVALERETQRPFLERQFELYTEAVDVVGRLNAAQRIDRLGEESEHLARFWELYWGPLAVVEDSQVERAMVFVGRSLEANRQEPAGDCAKALSTASLHLAHSVRKSMQTVWGVVLDADDELPKRLEREGAKLKEACPKT